MARALFPPPRLQGVLSLSPHYIWPSKVRKDLQGARDKRGKMLALKSESTRPVRIQVADSFAAPVGASCATTSRLLQLATRCKRKSLGHLFLLHSLPIFFFAQKCLISYIPVPAFCFKWRGPAAGAGCWRLVSNLKALPALKLKAPRRDRVHGFFDRRDLSLTTITIILAWGISLAFYRITKEGPVSPLGITIREVKYTSGSTLCSNSAEFSLNRSEGLLDRASKYLHIIWT